MAVAGFQIRSTISSAAAAPPFQCYPPSYLGHRFRLLPNLGTTLRPPSVARDRYEFQRVSMVPIFSAENVPASIRGGLVMS